MPIDAIQPSHPLSPPSPCPQSLPALESFPMNLLGYVLMDPSFHAVRKYYEEAHMENSPQPVLN